MSPRPLGPYLDTPGSYGHRPKSRWLWLPVVALLLAVFAFISGILPGGPVVEALSDRGARKALAEAEALENKSLNISAAAHYTKVAESVHVSPELRVKAARGMARVYRAIPGHAEDVEHGLEIAYNLSPAGEEKDAIKNELETKRGRPLASIQTSTPGQSVEDDASASATLVSLPPLPRNDHILARIGDETISTEEILFAWGQSNGPRKPSPDELKQFVRNYLDTVLMADEARRRGLDRKPETTYDLRQRRIMGLYQAITQQLIHALPKPDAKTLETYYNSHKELFTTPERVLIGHIIVKSPENEAKVAKALDQGQRFDKVAAQYSVDTKQLQNGYLLGWISKADTSIPGIGYNPRLVAKLLAMSDGDTTGPIRSQLGVNWIRVVNRTPAKLRPFNEVQKSEELLGVVLLNYQKTRLAEESQKLLQQLHQDRTIEIVDPAMRANLDGGEEPPAEFAPAGDAAATTETQDGGDATEETAAVATDTPEEAAAGEPAPQGPEGTKTGAAQTRAKSAE